MRFYDEMMSKWDLRSFSEIVIFLRDLCWHLGKCVEGFENVHGKMQKEEDCWSSVRKKSCAWQTRGFIKKRKEKSLMMQVDVK